MKKITVLSTLRQAQCVTLCFLLLTLGVNAQTPPNAFNYSAVARNAAGQPIASATIGIQITILKTSPTGASQYSENHFMNTDDFGLFNLVIGAGAVQSGSMATIDWSNDNYYLEVGMDATGGTNFLTMGTTQLLSVPYALQATKSNGITPNTELLLTNTLANSNLYITPPGLNTTGGLGTSTNHGLYFFTNNVDRAVFTSNGRFGFGTLNPGSTLTVGGGDINIEDIGSGIIMKSPNGNCWRVTVDNSGTFISTPITCP
jgi:hypothetical protein